jgi:hypothetical protein
MIKLSKITIEITKKNRSRSFSHVHYSCFKYFIIVFSIPRNVELQPLRTMAAIYRTHKTNIITEHVRVNFYSGSSWFESRSKHELFRHGFFFPASRQYLQTNAGVEPRIRWRSLANSFQFIINQSSYHSMLYSLRYWESRNINLISRTVFSSLT